MSEKSPNLDALREKVAAFPQTPGVYLMKDARGRVIYVGKAVRLRPRVASYFQPAADLEPRKQQMVDRVADVDFLDAESEVEALLMENRLIKDLHPKFNVRLTDDKTFPYLMITTREDFPGVYVTRTPQKGARLYGPFTDVYNLRESVTLLQKIFRFRTCNLSIRADDGERRFHRPCLLHPIRQCYAPCADRISKADYRATIRRFVRFMDGKRTALLREMKRKMTAAADRRNFEEAARLRDQIKAIDALGKRGKLKVHVQPEVFYVDPAEGLQRLAKILDLAAAPRVIEGIDIATLAGGESVGSLVQFVDGKPFKGGYRRFRIKTVRGLDDYGMIREVVGRRYSRLQRQQETFPDVVLIDGGLGQLHAALEGFEQVEHAPPRVVGLAKREEELFTAARAEPLRLPRRDPALRLLQYVRDEAHRFAQHYHHILRRKKTFDQEMAPTRRPPRRPRRRKS
jgi:excinuclease ABC subunit C